jgi:hypothetical protein
MKIFWNVEPISGFVFGAEYAEAYEVANEFDEEGEVEYYISIDLFFFRILLEFVP